MRVCDSHFSVLLFRESFVYLKCDHSLGDGKEQITTDGDSAIILNYVCQLNVKHILSFTYILQLAVSSIYTFVFHSRCFI